MRKACARNDAESLKWYCLGAAEALRVLQFGPVVTCCELQLSAHTRAVLVPI